MKVPYKVSKEYAMIFTTPFVVAEVIGLLITIGGLSAYVFFR